MKHLCIYLSIVFISLSVRSQCVDSSLVLDLNFKTGGIDNSIYNHDAFVPQGLKQRRANDRFGDSTTYGWDKTANTEMYIVNFDSSAIKPSFPITVSMWIKIDTAGVRHALFTNDDFGGTLSGIWIDITTSNKISANVGSGRLPGPVGRRTSETLDSIKINKWYQLFVVFESLGNTKIFIDGEQKTTINSGTGNSLYYNINNVKPAIGRYFKASINNLRGSLDDLKMWKRKLSEEEILDRYLFERNYRALVLHRPFTNNSVDISLSQLGVLDDSSIQDTTNHLGSPTTAYYFNGTSSSLSTNVNTPQPLRVKFPFSCSIWLNLADSSQESFIYTNNDNLTQLTGFWIKTFSGQPSISFGNGGAPSSNARKTATSSAVLRSNYWHYVTFIAHKFDSVEIYVDTTLTNTTYSGSGSSIFYSNVGGESIGAMFKGRSSGNYFKGSIGDIKVWNQAISNNSTKNILQYAISNTENIDLIDSLSISTCTNNDIVIMANQSIGLCNYNWSSGSKLPIENSTNFLSGFQKVIITAEDSLGRLFIDTLEVNNYTLDTSIINSLDTLIGNELSANYQWLDCNNNFQQITGANQRKFKPNGSGNYAVEISNLSGCVDTSGCINISTVGLDDIDNNLGFSLYPNPVNNLLYLETVSGFNQFEIYNTIGVLEKKGPINNGMNQINLDSFTNGSYFIVLLGQDSETRQGRFVVVK